MTKDWLAWHDAYDHEDSLLAHRLGIVQGHLRRMLDEAPPGPVHLISMCAGQGRDVLGVLADHARRSDVVARLVELDDRNAQQARARADDLGLVGVEVVQGDASTTSAYAGAVPADIVLVCGVFGNVDDADIATTVQSLSSLCAPGASVLWTRYRRDEHILDQIDTWFRGVGFEQVVMETGDGELRFGVGVHRLVAAPRAFRPDIELFTFLDDPDPTGAGR